MGLSAMEREKGRQGREDSGAQRDEIAQRKVRRGSQRSLCTNKQENNN